MKFFFTAAMVIMVGALSYPFNIMLSIKSAAAETIISHTVKIIKRKVVGGKSLRVTQDDKITLNWQTDENVDIHLHGYNIKKIILIGQTITMKFTAKLTGRFPITSHGFSGEKNHSHGKKALFYLEVHPE
jgi:heme/copper-type cytochrome/quinol oxidase subunit 2